MAINLKVNGVMTPTVGRKSDGVVCRRAVAEMSVKKRLEFV